MKVSSTLSTVAGLVVAATFVARAVTGVPAAWAHRQGRLVEADKHYLEAMSQLDQGDGLTERTDPLWRSARARIKYWYTLPDAERSSPRGESLLREAAVRLLLARESSPGAAWLTSVFGYVYSCRERMSRAHHILNLAELERGPWSLIGDDARIAIGLSRAAIAGEPNYFESHDQLVFLLENNGLHEEALRAMAGSARALPEFDAHDEFDFESLSRDLIDAFWRASRAVDPADVPFELRERHLLSLGQLGRNLGHLAEAEIDLRAALDSPGTSLAHAEDAFHLAQVLIDQSRLDAAETYLALAIREPVFELGVAESRARIAEKRERWPEALAQLRFARRFKPRDMPLLLEFASIAQKAGAADEASEALRWAMVVHPEDPAPRRATILQFLAQGDRERARRALDEYIQSFGRTEDAVALEKALAGSIDEP